MSFPPVHELSGDVEQTLLERARQLAQVAVDTEAVAAVDVLLFRTRGEQYAVELRSLESVQSAQDLTRIPCTPSRIAGIINVRGDVITVIDLAVVLGLDDRPARGQAAQVLLGELPAGRVGLLVDEVTGIARLALDRLAPSLAGHGYTLGIDEGTTIVLRLDDLLIPDRLDVLEHVS
jgi:purine-binding chemotaxis protein CheW